MWLTSKCLHKFAAPKITVSDGHLWFILLLKLILNSIFIVVWLSSILSSSFFLLSPSLTLVLTFSASNQMNVHISSSIQILDYEFLIYYLTIIYFLVLSHIIYVQKPTRCSGTFMSRLVVSHDFAQNDVEHKYCPIVISSNGHKILLLTCIY